jgi:hypothetical protein
MIILNFNTKTHKLTFINEGKSLTFDNISTIKKDGDIYEVFCKLEEGSPSVPFGKFPVNSTIILYTHEA